MANKRKAIDSMFEGSLMLSKQKRQNQNANQTNKKKKKNPTDSGKSTQVNNTKDPSVAEIKTKRSVENVIIKLYEQNEKVYSAVTRDASRDLSKYLNASDRRDDTLHNYGDTITLTNMLGGYVKESLDMLSKLPNINKNREFYLGTQVDEIIRLKDSLNSAKNASTLPELITTVLSLRPSLIRLMSTVDLLEADPGLLNTPDFIETHMWNGQTAGGSLLQRDTLSDNAVLPDRTIVKPIFLLFIDEKIKNELRSLNVDNRVIDMLGNYSIPSYRWDGELNSLNSMFNNNGALKDPQMFGWSNNGTLARNMKTVSAYQKNTTEFLNQVQAKYKLAQSKALMEYTYEVAIFEVLTSWLNGAFKALVEANSFVLPEVLKGIQFERDRLLPVDNASLALQYLIESADSSGKVKAPFTALFESIDTSLKSNLSRKLIYNEYAYTFVKREFKTLTFSIDDKSSKYYIGSTLIGNHKIKINILPKLYLPVNLKTPQRMDFTSSSGVVVRAIDAFRFQLQVRNSFYIKDRDTTYNSTITIFSIMHELINMPAASFNQAITDFFSDKGVVTYNGAAVTFNKLFNSAFDERRELSAIPPHYYKDILIGKTMTVFESEVLSTNPEDPAPDVSNKWYWPHMDMALMKDTLVNDNGIWAISQPYLFGDVLRSLYNFHGDFSWIEMGIVFAQLATRGLFLYRPHLTVVNPTDLGAAATLDSGDVTGDLRTTYVTTTSGDYGLTRTEYTWARVMRQAYYTQLYTLKENPNNVKWLETFEFKSNPSLKPTLIGKNDIDDVNRYQFITRNGINYIIDVKLLNKNVKNLPIITAVDGMSRFSGVKRLLVDNAMGKVTESEIRNDILDADILNKGLLFFNERTDVEDFAKDPAIIPGTDLFAFEVPAHFSLANINSLIYIKDNFVPYYQSFSVSLPTNCNRNDKYVNNIMPARFTSHALIASGVLQSNLYDSIRVIASSFGIPARQYNSVIFPEGDAQLYDVVSPALPIDYIDPADTDAVVTDPNADTFGFVTSDEYGSFLHFRVDISLNALLNTGFYGILPAEYAANVSFLKSNQYMEYFGLPHVSPYHVTDLVKSKRTELVTLDVAVNAANLDHNLRISLKPRDIIMLLDMEDPTYAYQRTILE